MAVLLNGAFLHIDLIKIQGLFGLPRSVVFKDIVFHSIILATLILNKAQLDTVVYKHTYVWLQAALVVLGGLCLSRAVSTCSRSSTPKLSECPFFRSATR
jgi:hypothetical protein